MTMMALRSEQIFISVVMPVHNALPHLDDAIRSILDQTHRNFEFVIYDDASTDGSIQRLREWVKRDARIRLIEGGTNMGPVGSSAMVVEKSTAPIIARMDGDDLCDPRRLELGLQVLHEHPEAGLVGTLFDIIDDRDRQIRRPDFWRLARKSPFVPFAAHGSIMFRRAVFERVGGYRPECEYWEDQDLVARIASASDVMVIPRPLYRVRQWARRPGSDDANERVENAVDLMYRCVARLEQGLGYDDLLAESRSQSAVRLDPRVFISAGSKALWSGGRPRLFGRLLERGKLGLDRKSATALVWTAWATVSPLSLRAFLRLLLTVKNARARSFKSIGEPLRWSPSGGAPRRRSASGPTDATPGLVRSADSR